MCKQCLNMPTRCSNIACRAELGRFPHVVDILSAVIKYNERLKFSKSTDLVNSAVITQRSMSRNSNNTFTYPNFAESILELLNLPRSAIIDIPRDLPISSMKYKIKQFGKMVTRKIKSFYIHNIFTPFLNTREEDTHDRLHLYSCVKTQYKYEPYLDIQHPHRASFTRFRLSLHWLPIERGRYSKPRVPREERICTLCNSNDIADELHCLLKCQADPLKILRDISISKLASFDTTFDAPYITSRQTLQLMMTGDNPEITKVMFEWVHKCNDIFKPRQK